MDKFTEELENLRTKIKKEFLRRFEKSTNGRAYYNWTDSDDLLIELVYRELRK